MLKLEPGLALARHQLALAQLQAGHLQQARASLKEAATLDPDLVESILLLAELDIQAGALQPAIERLEGHSSRGWWRGSRGRCPPGCSWARPIWLLPDLRKRGIRDRPAPGHRRAPSRRDERAREQGAARCS